MLYLHLLFIALFAACSFKSSKQEDVKPPVARYEELKPEDLAKMDSDGDRINDLEEKERGLNAFVADIPELRVRFLQNYSIKVNWHVRTPDGRDHTDSAWDFTIDTRVGRNEPDFKYRVGEILVRNKALQEAARIGRFSNHSWGDIQESDLTRVIYPEVDARFSSRNALVTGKYFDSQGVAIDKVTIELENSAKLLPSSVYSSIKNLELNFYYFNYETETYELLSTQVVDRHFNRDVNETFSVVLENVPVALVADNYLKRGEFIISEVKDFEIPEIGVKYSELMNSVKAKTVQMVVNTPLETKSLFVAPDRSKKRFSDLMEKTYPKQFKIEEDKIVKVGQFENNLSDYTHLLEVKGEDKKGKWFIFTNRLTRSYLDHEFSAGEAVVLSYVTGNYLAEQTSEKVHALRFNITGSEDYQVFPLGNVSPNSVVDFQLYPQARKGEKVDKMEDRPSSPGGSCGRNCIVRQFDCHFKFHVFKPRNEGYEFQKNLSQELSQLFLIINEDEFSLKELVQTKKVEIYWKDKFPHFRISDISKIKELFEADENLISLKIKTLSETTHEGVNLVSFSGRDYSTCFELAGAAAFSNKWPIYEGSKEFHKWRHLYNWNVIKLGRDRNYKQPFTLDVSSTVNNYHN